mmetsp:Transcript_544/g.1489  ORF Transcript_544/g.1489 Transcript_544/m.1489 type:complete len:343 (+) Transcript_544:487-1515(+)
MTLYGCKRVSTHVFREARLCLVVGEYREAAEVDGVSEQYGHVVRRRNGNSRGYAVNRARFRCWWRAKSRSLPGTRSLLSTLSANSPPIILPTSISSSSSSSSAADAVVVDTSLAVDAKASVMAVLESAGNDDDKRAFVNESMLKMEAANPTPMPASSPLLDGTWRLAYQGSVAPAWASASPTREIALFMYAGGFGPSEFLLKVAQRLPDNICKVDSTPVITISNGGTKTESATTVKLLGSAGEVTGKAMSSLVSESASRLRETYDAVMVNGNKFDLPANLKYERALYITYLDDDTLVVRDDSGAPDVWVRVGGAPVAEAVVEDDSVVPAAELGTATDPGDES